MRMLAWIALAWGAHLLSAAERPEVRTGLVVGVEPARHRLLIEESPGAAPTGYLARPGDLELPWAGRRIRFEVLTDAGKKYPGNAQTWIGEATNPSIRSEQVS